MLRDVRLRDIQQILDVRYTLRPLTELFQDG